MSYRLLSTTALAVTLVCLSNPSMAFDDGAQDWSKRTSPVHGFEHGEQNWTTSKQTGQTHDQIEISDVAKKIVAKTSKSADQSEEIVAMTSKSSVQSAPEFEPLVFNKGGKVTVSDTMLDIAYINYLANELSYDIVKGNVKLSDDHMTQLSKLGWDVVGSFTGLEGAHLNWGDHSGIVLYNQDKNMFIVAWHGTASNAEGWETNINADLIKSSKVSNNVIEAVYNELRDTLEKEIKNVTAADESKAVDAADNLNALYTFVTREFNEEKTNGMTTDQFRTKMNDMLKLTRLMVNEGNIDQSMFNKVEHIAKMKLEVLDDIDARNASGDSSKALEGRVHKGYMMKVASGQKAVEDIIMRQLEKLGDEQRKGIRIAVTGHSMAGALAKLSAAELLSHSKQLFGHDIDNAKENRILVHALSSAPTGDNEFRDWIETNLGKHNIFDQKVETDIVPKAYYTDVMNAFIGEIPVAGKKITELLDKFKGYAAHIGYAAIDLDEDVQERAEKLYASKGVLGYTKAIFEETGNALLKNLNPVSFVQDIRNAIDDEETTTGKVTAFFKSFFLGGATRVAKTAAAPFVGAGKTAIHEVVRKKVAVPHYGIDLEDASQQPKGQDYGRTEHFEPSLLTPEDLKEGLNKMLAKGQVLDPTVEKKDSKAVLADLEKRLAGVQTLEKSTYTSLLKSPVDLKMSTKMLMPQRPVTDGLETIMLPQATAAPAA